jgi:hypothetical protein
MLRYQEVEIGYSTTYTTNESSFSVRVRLIGVDYFLETGLS